SAATDAKNRLRMTCATACAPRRERSSGKRLPSHSTTGVSRTQVYACVNHDASSGQTNAPPSQNPYCKICLLTKKSAKAVHAQKQIVALFAIGPRRKPNTSSPAPDGETSGPSNDGIGS